MKPLTQQPTKGDVVERKLDLDTYDRERIEHAIANARVFAVRHFIGRGQYARAWCLSLAQAIEAGETMRTHYSNARLPMIYALLDDGGGVFIPPRHYPK